MICPVVSLEELQPCAEHFRPPVGSRRHLFIGGGATLVQQRADKDGRGRAECSIQDRSG